MEIESKYKSQMAEFIKMDYVFFESLARGEEPLTYTFKPSDDDSETQVEISSRFAKDKDSLIIDFGFDTNYGGRFTRKKGKFYTYKLNVSNQWIIISSE